MPTCQECGESVPTDAAKAHAEDHWPEEHLRKMEADGDPRHFAEARKRKNALLGQGESY